MLSHKETTRVSSCSSFQMESSPSTGLRQNTKEKGKMLVPWPTDSVIALASAEYKGKRKSVGSMANGLSDCIGFGRIQRKKE